MINNQLHKYSNNNNKNNTNNHINNNQNNYLNNNQSYNLRIIIKDKIIIITKHLNSCIIGIKYIFIIYFIYVLWYSCSILFIIIQSIIINKLNHH